MEITCGSGSVLRGNQQAAIVLNLGHAYDAAHKPAEAMETYGLALSMVDGLAGGTDATAVRRESLQALARIHFERGELDQSQRYDRLLLREQIGLAAPMQAAALARLARSQKMEGDLLAARNSLAEALALQEQSSSPNPSGLLAAIEAFAEFLTHEREFVFASKLHERAVAILESVEPAGVRLAHHHNELGLCALQMKDYAKAQEQLRQALLIQEALDPHSLAAARIHANLAQAYEASQDDASAQSRYRRALSLYERHGDTAEAQLGQAQALNYLAGYDFRRRRLAQAEPQFLRAIALTERADGATSPRLLPLLDNLLALYRSQQRAVQASAISERVQQLRRAQPEPVL